MLHIERIDPTQWSRLRRLRLAALADAPDAFGSTLADITAMTPDDFRAQLTTLATFVAVVDGADVGLVRGGPDAADPTTALLVSMWVAPQARRAGIGEDLVNTVVAWARDNGYHRLALDVTSSNTQAVALYERMQFVATGATNPLPAPRAHLQEHRRERDLSLPGS